MSLIGTSATSLGEPDMSATEGEGVVSQTSAEVRVLTNSRRRRLDQAAYRSQVPVGHDLRISIWTNDFATSWAHAMNRSTTGLKVRCLSVTTTTGHGRVGKAIGKMARL